MFSQPEAPKQSRLRAGHLVSIATHGMLLALLIHQPEPRFIQPTAVMAGRGGTAMSIVYLPATVQAGERAAADTHQSLTLPVRKKKAPKIAPAEIVAKAEGEKTKGADVATTLAGSPYGSLGNGPAYGHEIRPALPSIFPDPVPPSLPRGVQGDVVVQVTIDIAGNITETKVVKTIGYGAEERVLAALQQWRFRPATQDGIAIPSQQYMYFHFPS